MGDGVCCWQTGSRALAHTRGRYQEAYPSQRLLSAAVDNKDCLGRLEFAKGSLDFVSCYDISSGTDRGLAIWPRVPGFAKGGALQPRLFILLILVHKGLICFVFRRGVDRFVRILVLSPVSRPRGYLALSNQKCIWGFSERGFPERLLLRLVVKPSLGQGPRRPEVNNGWQECVSSCTWWNAWNRCD